MTKIRNSNKILDSNSESEMCESSTIEFADKPPLKQSVWYSINQIEILTNFGNYTFATYFESDDFFQKLIQLMEKPDSTKTNRLKAPWQEKFRFLGLDSNEYIYMDERLNVPKALGPINLRSLHYGHPGRDSMLATVANLVAPSTSEGRRNSPNVPPMQNCL